MYIDDVCVDNASYKVQLDSINEVPTIMLRYSDQTSIGNWMFIIHGCQISNIFISHLVCYCSVILGVFNYQVCCVICHL